MHFAGQIPELTNHRILARLGALQRSGRIRPGAEAIFLLEKSHDDKDWPEAARLAQWSESIAFDERGHCASHAPPSARHLCVQAHGIFRVVSIKLSALPTILTYLFV